MFGRKEETQLSGVRWFHFLQVNAGGLSCPAKAQIQTSLGKQGRSEKQGISF